MESSNRTNHTQYSPKKQKPQKPSSFKESMCKSILSKISGYSSILNGISPDQNLQILRISLKKQLDRKEKLQRLMQKYQQITTQQKVHIKAIKSNIIELKDVETNSKTKFFLNPIIYVDNSLSKQTREYLCMLLNTFYAKYEENSQCQFRTKQLNKEMNHLLQNISQNQENLLNIEKQTIGVQVHLEGEMLALKSKLKDQTQKHKSFQEEYKRIQAICTQYQNDYNLQFSKVQKLRKTQQKIQQQIAQLKQKVAHGQNVKHGKEAMMANQIAYQERFQDQLNSVDQDIEKQKQKQSILQNKIKQKKFKVQQLKTQLSKLKNLTQTLKNAQSQTENFKIDQSIQESKEDSNKMTRSHLSLGKIKKYSQVINEMNNSTLEMSKSTLKFCYEVMSKDTVDHTVGMRVIDIKKQRNSKNSMSKITLR